MVDDVKLRHFYNQILMLRVTNSFSFKDTNYYDIFARIFASVVCFTVLFICSLIFEILIFCSLCIHQYRFLSVIYMFLVCVYFIVLEYFTTTVITRLPKRKRSKSCSNSRAPICEKHTSLCSGDKLVLCDDCCIFFFLMGMERVFLVYFLS